MVVRILALVAALVLSLAPFNVGHASDRYEGVIVIDGTQCYEITPAGEIKPWGMPMAAGTRVSIFTVDHQFSEDWTLIGFGSDSSEGCLVSKGSVEAVTSDPVPDEPEPTVEPTIAPTPIEPEVEPTTEPDPTETTPIEEVNPTVEPTVEPTTEPEPELVEKTDPVYEPEPTVEPESTELTVVDETAVLATATTEAVSVDPTPVAHGALGVTTLPRTGTGSGDSSVDTFDWAFLVKTILLALAILAVVVLLFFGMGCIDGWRDYRDGVDTGASRVLKKVLGKP